RAARGGLPRRPRGAERGGAVPVRALLGGRTDGAAPRAQRRRDRRQRRAGGAQQARGGPALAARGAAPPRPARAAGARRWLRPGEPLLPGAAEASAAVERRGV